MDEHEEATARLRAIFATWAIADFESGPGDHSFEHCDFSELERLLAARDRAVAANAWDEADARLTEWHESKKGHWDNESRPGYRIWVEHSKPSNPYRITEENN